MFQFPAFASLLGSDSHPSDGWVAPFRHPRIKGRLHLPVDFRSLPRLSSPSRAQASAVRPCLLSPAPLSPFRDADAYTLEFLFALFREPELPV